MNLRSLLLSALLAIGACSPPPSTRDTTSAVLWIQTAAEFEIAVRQSYRIALERLDLALAAAPPPRAPAIIADLDETLLDNSTFEARLLARDVEFDREAWHAWQTGTEARALPGAVEFLAGVRQRGVAVYLVTNRAEEYRAPTLASLRKTGLATEADDGVRLLLLGERPEWTADKTSRREFVARDHTVLLVVGNDLNDFVDARGRDLAARQALVAEHADRFGRDWILVPSPLWGSSLDAVDDFRTDLSPAELRALRLSRLRLD